MKNKIKTLGIIALMAVIMFTMIACKEEEEDEPVDNSKFYLQPPAPIVTKNEGSTVYFTWAAIPDARNYDISIRSNLDGPDTRRNIGWTDQTSWEYNYDGWGGGEGYKTGVTTLYFYFKANPKLSGYVASGWSLPVIVTPNPKS